MKSNSLFIVTAVQHALGICRRPCVYICVSEIQYLRKTTSKQRNFRAMASFPFQVSRFSSWPALMISLSNTFYWGRKIAKFISALYSRGLMVASQQIKPQTVFSLCFFLSCLRVLCLWYLFSRSNHTTLCSINLSSPRDIHWTGLENWHHAIPSAFKRRFRQLWQSSFSLFFCVHF